MPTLWSECRLQFRVLTSAGEKTIGTERPYAIVGAGPNCDIRLPVGPVQHCLLVASEFGIHVAMLTGQAEPIGDRLADGEAFSIFGSEIRVERVADDPTLLSSTNVPPKSDQLGFAVLFKGLKVAAARPIVSPLNVIGSQRPSSWRVQAEGIAPRHFAVYSTGDRAWAIDLRNGVTRIGKETIDVAELGGTQIVQFGQFYFRFIDREEAAEIRQNKPPERSRSEPPNSANTLGNQTQGDLTFSDPLASGTIEAADDSTTKLDNSTAQDALAFSDPLASGTIESVDDSATNLDSSTAQDALAFSDPLASGTIEAVDDSATNLENSTAQDALTFSDPLASGTIEAADDSAMNLDNSTAQDELAFSEPLASGPIESIDDDSSTNLGDLTAQVDEADQSLREHVSNVQGAVSEPARATDVESVRTELADIRQQFAKLSNAVSEMNAALQDGEPIRGVQQELVAVQTQLRTLRAESIDFNETVTARLQQAEGLRESVPADTASRSHVPLGSEVGLRREDVVELENDLHKIDQGLQAVRQAVFAKEEDSSAVHSEMQVLRDDITSIRASWETLEQLQNDQASARRCIEETASTVEGLKEELSKTQSQLNQYCEQRRESDAAQSEKLAEAIAGLERTQQEITAAKADFVTLDRLEELASSVELLKSESASVRNDIKRLSEHQLDDESESLRRLREEFAAFQSKLEQMETSLAAGTQWQESETNRITQEIARTDKLSRELAELVVTLDDQQGALRDAEATRVQQAEELRQELDNGMAAIRSRLEEIDRDDTEIEQLRNDFTSLSSTVEQLQHSHDEQLRLANELTDRDSHSVGQLRENVIGTQAALERVEQAQRDASETLTQLGEQALATRGQVDAFHAQTANTKADAHEVALLREEVAVLRDQIERLEASANSGSVPSESSDVLLGEVTSLATGVEHLDDRQEETTLHASRDSHEKARAALPNDAELEKEQTARRVPAELRTDPNTNDPRSTTPEIDGESDEMSEATATLTRLQIQRDSRRTPLQALASRLNIVLWVVGAGGLLLLAIVLAMHYLN